MLETVCSSPKIWAVMSNQPKHFISRVSGRLRVIFLQPICFAVLMSHKNDETAFKGYNLVLLTVVSINRLRLRANGRSNSQYCCANDVGSCCVRVGSGVQTNTTTPNNVGRIQPISLCKPCVMSVRGPNNVGRAVQTDPTLLRYASAITEQKKCWELLVVGQQLPKLLDVKCCARLHTLLHVVGCCCAKFETGQTFQPTTPDISFDRLITYLIIMNHNQAHCYSVE